MKKYFKYICVLAALSLVLGACSNASESTADTQTNKTTLSQEIAAQTGAEEQTAEEDEGTPTETAAPEPTETAASEPTETATPEPTAAPTAEPTPAVSMNDLVVLQDPYTYYYTDMINDSQVIAQLYQGLVTLDSIGTTADGRELIHFVVGNPDAPKQIFINASTHAREYLTTQLVMKQLVVYLAHVAAGDYYGDVSYADMWNQCAIHVVPMVNPDGVTISQLGIAGLQNESVINAVYEIAAMDGMDPSGEYLETWKANALGTDINRNYDAYWNEYNDPVGHPSSDMYKGEYPGSCAEAAAMINLTNSCHFSRTISYHTQGQCIYWNFYDIDDIYDEAYSFACEIAAQTGYYMDGNYEGVDPAGYSDWGLYVCRVPSITLECGTGVPPYMEDQFQQIWGENVNVWETTVLSALNSSIG